MRSFAAMLPSADVIRADFDRIANHFPAAESLEPSAARVLAMIPQCARVLEVGCGTGIFARALAVTRGARITAIDLAPRMIDLARERTQPNLGIAYAVVDFMDQALSGFDVAVAINTLHHLPLGAAAERLASTVTPGGLVLIADLFEARGVRELPYNLLSWLLRKPRPKDPALAAAWNEHGQHETQLPLREIRTALRGGLPGVAIRRHLRWRYTALWRRPA